MSTLRLYFDVRTDFTGLLLVSDVRHDDMDGALGGRPSAPLTSSSRPHVLLRRLVIAFTDRDAFTDFAHRRLASRYSV